MSDVLEIRLPPGDRAAHDRLRDILNFQTGADRLGRWRRLWTTMIAAASISLSLSLFQRTSPRHIARWSGALWATALLAAIGCGLIEWRLRRRLRSLLAQADVSVRALE
jgi:hypothetical protein